MKRTCMLRIGWFLFMTKAMFTTLQVFQKRGGIIILQNQQQISMIELELPLQHGGWIFLGMYS